MLKIIEGKKVQKESQIPRTTFFCQAFALEEQRAELAFQNLSHIDFSSTAGGPASNQFTSAIENLIKVGGMGCCASYHLELHLRREGRGKLEWMTVWACKEKGFELLNCCQTVGKRHSISEFFTVWSSTLSIVWCTVLFLKGFPNRYKHINFINLIN